MSTNDSIRQKQSGSKAKAGGLAAEISRSTGVDEGDVAKVLDQLGLSRGLAAAVRLNEGQELQASNARIAFHVGRTLLIM
jgi:hypothetical protein